MNRFLKRFFGKDCFNVQDNIENLKQKQKPIYELPVDLANPLIDYMLERSYLEDISQRTDFNIVEMPEYEDIGWIRIERLPVSPLRIDDYDLLSRWKGVL